MTVCEPSFDAPGEVGPVRQKPADSEPETPNSRATAISPCTCLPSRGSFHSNGTHLSGEGFWLPP